MVEILNPKQKIFGANKKKTFKAYPTKPNNKYRENKGQRLSGKLPEFKQQKTYKKYDDTIIKSLCQQILQKKASKLEKKSAIKTVIEFIEKDTPRFIVKKWILRALEFSLKYGDSICRQKITTLFNENRETVLKCSSGKKLVLKIFAYAYYGTPSSSLLYVNLIPEILPPLLNYLEFHMDIALKCQFMSNIILQIFKNHEGDASFRSFVDINAISLWITKLAPVVDENQVPFFSIKQVSWLSIKLIFEDATRDYIFINALVSHLDDAILSIWLQHKSTSFILSKVIEKAPSSLGEKLKEKIKFKSMDIN
ncbi:hypothetical protein HZS_424, partial [Henneguya salminicola]